MIDFSAMLDPTLGLIDPGTLEGSKMFLKLHGFSEGFGQPDTIANFEKFVNRETGDGSYGGKSTEWGMGGRAAILKHKLIVSGHYGNSLNDIQLDDWSEIMKIVRINAIKKMAQMESLGRE